MKKSFIVAIFCSFSYINNAAPTYHLTKPTIVINIVDNFEEQLEAALAKLGAGESLIIKKNDAGYVFTIVAGGGSVDPVFKVRCQGDGISFIKCVKKAIDTYGCQKLEPIKEGGYSSSDCP